MSFMKFIQIVCNSREMKIFRPMKSILKEILEEIYINYCIEACRFDLFKIRSEFSEEKMEIRDWHSVMYEKKRKGQLFS